MKNISVYFSINNVLGDIDNYLLEAFGSSLSDIWNAAYDIAINPGKYTADEAMEYADRIVCELLRSNQTWLGVKPMPHACELVDTALSATNKVYVLVPSPLPYQQILLQQCSFVQNYFPELKDNIICVTSCSFGPHEKTKKTNHCSSSRSIIVDENQKHCDEWSQAGGAALFLPRELSQSRDFIADFSWIVQHTAEKPYKKIQHEVSSWL